MRLFDWIYASSWLQPALEEKKIELIDFFLSTRWILPAIYIAGGIVLGIVFDRVVLKRLERMTAPRDRSPKDTVVKSIKKFSYLFFFIAGVYFSLYHLPLSDRNYDIISRIHIVMLIMIGSIVLGIIFEKVVLQRLEKTASKTEMEADDFIIKSFKNMTLLFFIIAGFYLSLIYLPLTEGTVAFIRKVLMVILILSMTIVAARISVGFIEIYTKRIGGAFPSTSIFTNLTYVLVLVIGILIVLQSIGVSIAPLLTALGVGGLAAALALQDTLSNIFSGIHIIASGKVKPGDFIMLESGETGYVTDITWRNTVIRAISNNMIIVPNSKLSSNIITNYNQPYSWMSVLIPVGVSYDSDLERVEEITLEVARSVMKEVEGGLPDYEPLIRYNAFADSSINFNVVIRAHEYTNQFLLRHEFIKRLHARYNKEGIDIPFPITTIYMHRGEEN